jgi:ATP-binding cassette subfamily B protein
LLPFLGRMLKEFSIYKRQSLLIAISISLYLAFRILFPLSIKFIIDNAIALNDQDYLWRILLLIILSALIAFLACSVLVVLYARVHTRIISDLYKKIFSRLQELSVSFFTRTSAGDILTRFNTDVNLIDTLLVQLPIGIMFFLGVLLNAALLYYLNWQLALITTVGLPLALWLPNILSTRAETASYDLKTNLAGMTSVMQENIHAQVLVKAFNLQPYEIQRFSAQLDYYYKVARRANFLNFSVLITANFGIIILSIVVLSVGSLLAFRGSLTIGSLMAFMTMLSGMNSMILELTWMMPLVTKATASMKRIDELLQVEPTITDQVPPQELALISQEIAFQDVTFGYNETETNLTNINLRIPFGSYVAFVGASGSGKSTIIKLIMRFYDPGTGAITIDGKNIRSVTQHSLRAQMGIVFQENMLFNLSIRENIRLGKLEATDAEIEQAAKAVGIHDAILNLPQGYATLVGEGGAFLSGGQRQRLAIARALLRDPGILLLDEATSALDPASETVINRTIRNIARTRTVISVTHRLSSVQEADWIFVLEKGRIIEQGTHKELLNLESSRYRDLWQNQTGFILSEDGMNAEITINRLKNIPIFQEMNDDFLESLVPMFVSEYHPANRLIIEEGDLGDKFYILVRGKVEVSKRLADGKEKQLAILHDGDFFGEIALLKDIPRTATIRTLTPALFISLQKRMFHRMLEKAPHLSKLLSIRYN